MPLIAAEARKHRAFREAWIALLLASLYFALCLEPYATSALAHPWQNWTSMEQDIRCYTGNAVAFVLCIGLPRLICCEREMGTDRLLCTAKQGCQDTWLAKCLYAALYAAVVVGTFGGVNLLIHGSRFHFAEASLPVTGLSTLMFRESSPPPMSNLAWAVTQYGLFYLGALAYAGFLLLAAALVRRTLPAILLGGATYLAGYIWFLAGARLSLGQTLTRILDLLYRFSFTSYLLMDSWTGATRPGSWSDLWKPGLVAAAVILLEAAALRLLWKRRDRR